jgi:hypothetical protein
VLYRVNDPIFAVLRRPDVAAALRVMAPPQGLAALGRLVANLKPWPLLPPLQAPAPAGEQE